MSNSRDFGLNHTGAGKGDADRSPGWRDNYDSIDWRRDRPNAEGTALEPVVDQEFVLVRPGVQRKVYKTS